MNYLLMFSLSLFAFSTFATEPFKLSAYDMSPLARYLSEDDYKDLMRGSGQKNTVEGKVLTIDTRDQKSCLDIIEQLELEESICEVDEATPYISIMTGKSIDSSEFNKKIDLNFSDSQKEALREVRNFAVLGAATMGVVYMLPESVTMWDKSKIKVRYFENVKNKPVMDKDPWAVNYIGHPLSGAAFYVFARHKGMSKMKSTAFTVMMSTFYWEYGFEALIEEPSIQDLIITPLLGAVIGEVFYQAILKIDKNDGKVFGSKKYGSVAKVIMNPADHAMKQLNKLLGPKFIKSTETTFVMGRAPHSDAAGVSENFAGFNFKFVF